MCARNTIIVDQGLLECSYGSWYPRYSNLSPASRVIDLDPAFVDFLQEDGLVLHEQSEALPQRQQPGDIVVEGVDYDPNDLYSEDSSSSNSDTASDTSSSSSSSSGSNAAAASQPWSERFPELHGAIAAAIQSLGGAVAPRLNWSSPSDALWLTSSNSLCCTNPDEVLLLLKGSDRVAHDLDTLQQLQQQAQQQQHNNSSSTCTTSHPAPSGQHQQQQQQQQQELLPGHTSCQQQHTPPVGSAQDHPLPTHANGQQISSSSSTGPLCGQLVLRRWVLFQPEWQFRCFVCAHHLVAISQRDAGTHYPQLTATTTTSSSGSSDTQQQQHSLSVIKARLIDFHRTHIGNSFPLDAYAMDVYCPPSGPIQLLDVSPIADTTSPLCFSWDELPYTHMTTAQHNQQTHQQHQHTQLEPRQQQQQQCQEEGSRADDAEAVSSSSSSSSKSAAAAAPSGVVLRVVDHEGMIVPGARVATGMPYDMLGLPDAVSAVMKAMQEQQLQH